MKWPRNVGDNVTVVVDEVNVDEAVAKIEKVIEKFEARRMALLHTIAEAKSERTKLENAIASARRKGRSW